jgi:hypothetical protein
LRGVAIFLLSIIANKISNEYQQQKREEPSPITLHQSSAAHLNFRKSRSVPVGMMLLNLCPDLLQVTKQSGTILDITDRGPVALRSLSRHGFLAVQIFSFKSPFDFLSDMLLFLLQALQFSMYPSPNMNI